MRHALTLAAILVAVCFLFSTGSTKGLKASAVATPAPLATPALTEPCPDGIDDIAHCTMPGGCGELGDDLLNRAKNRTDIPPAGAQVQAMTIDDIKALPQPKTWDTGMSREKARQAGEGKLVSLTGFLQVAKHEGAESCNCDLTRRADTDVHMVMVSDLEDAETDSVTAEITPRFRKAADHLPGWLWVNVKNNLEGEYIRVTGRLMLDTKHIPQLHRLQGERPNKGLARATNWEVHPIMKIEVCRKSVTACDHGKGWETYN
jgi:hypothetical protein